MMTIGLFEHLAADDSDERTARRRAIAVAQKRVDDRFGAFLAAAETPCERTARLDVVRGDIQEVIASACGEYGGDPKVIETSIFKHLATKEHMKGVGDKRNRQYEHVLASCHESHPDWSEDRCKEYAARTTNKTRAEKGETKSSRVAGELPLGPPAHGADGFEEGPEAVDGPYSEQGQPQSINLEPNWEGMRAWVQELEKTDPQVAQGIKDAMGSESPDAQEGAGPPVPGFDDQGRGLGFDDQGQAIPRTGSVHIARRPKLCPYHSEVMDISLASGDPTAGFNAMATHAWGPQHCQSSEFEGGCNFKPAMVTQAYWDEKAERAQQRAEERQRQQEIDQTVEETQIPDSLEGIDETPPVDDIAEGETITFDDNGGIDSELSDAPSAVGEGAGVALEPMAAATRQGEALKTVDVDQGSAKDGSPKINKDKWKPNALNPSGNLPERPEGEESEGSPHPTERVDVLERVVTDRSDDFLDGTKAVTETQDVEQASGFDGSKADSGSWAGNNGASPVTSATVDIEKNPIKDLMEKGFVPDTQVEAAIKEFESAGA
jgi:hypothetical protein